MLDAGWKRGAKATVNATGHLYRDPFFGHVAI
jgi:hypothetical protein